MEAELARLDEHRGKQLLAAAGIPTPEGERATTAAEVRAIAERLGGGVVVKALALVTGRAGRGWVKLVDTPEAAETAAADLLSDPQVNAVRVERKLAIEREYFAAVLVDDRAGQPVAVLSGRGGSGIEEIAREHPEAVTRRHVDVRRGLHPYMGREMAAAVGITGKAQVAMGTLLSQLYQAFRQSDCRSLEINPVAWTAEEKLVAADCHAAIDDYAVFRHPELGIVIAREIGHEPNERELIAFQVEKHDYRGTFYFIQLADPLSPVGQAPRLPDQDAGQGPASPQYVAFHGAGGGGSMMSMDALMKVGFQPANFCDTSGNPPASKVYRAAKVLLGMPGIVGYFASGSGVASQEQWQSANGLIKAFREVGLRVPAVIRLGGNQEELAIERLGKFCADLGVPVEAYGKDDTARFCAERLRALVDAFTPTAAPVAVAPLSPAEMPADAYRFATVSGSIAIDQSQWTDATAQAVAGACPRKILKVVTEDIGEQDRRGEAMLRPQTADAGRSMASPLQGSKVSVVLAIPPEDAKKGKCIECLTCELKSFELGVNAVKVELPMPTKDGYSPVGRTAVAASDESRTGPSAPPNKGGAR